MLDVSTPQSPQIATPLHSDTYSAFRVAIAPEFAFTDQSSSVSSVTSVADMARVIDLAVTSSMAGRIHTVDITDPYNPTVMGVTKDDAGNEVITQATDITISKASGLVYITSGMSVYIIDIKDPNNPKLLNIVTTTPETPGSATMTTLGTSMALVEKDGWVYLANQQQGMRVLDLDPYLLWQYCGDGEFSSVSRQFCNDIYPALGTKTVLLAGVDANYKPLNFDDLVRSHTA